MESVLTSLCNAGILQHQVDGAILLPTNTDLDFYSIPKQQSQWLGDQVYATQTHVPILKLSLTGQRFRKVTEPFSFLIYTMVEHTTYLNKML